MVALIDPRTGQLVSDVIGAQQRGLQVQQQQQNLQVGQQGLQATQRAVPGDIQQQTLQAAITGAGLLKQVRDPEAKMQVLQQQRQALVDAGLPPTIADEGLELLTEGTPEALQELDELTDQLIAMGQKGPTGTERPFAPIGTQAGGLGIPVFDPRTGEARLEEIPGAVGETPEQKRQAQVQAATAQETGKLLAQQRQQIQTEITQKARDARRQIPDLKAVLKALETIETGVTTQAVATLGRFIPGVDPTDEEALAAQVNQLVLNKLSFFPGAISEGERIFAATTTANLGNTTEANRIIIKHAIKTLERAEKEQQQFKDFIAGGGQPEAFEFQSTQLQDLDKDELQGLTTEQLQQLLQ